MYQVVLANFLAQKACNFENKNIAVCNNDMKKQIIMVNQNLL